MVILEKVKSWESLVKTRVNSSVEKKTVNTDTV